MRLVLFLFTPFLLFGAQILDYKVLSDRSNYTDIMFYFDTPFEGKMAQAQKGNKLTLLLKGASIEAQRSIIANTTYLKTVIISPSGDNTKLLLELGTNVKMKASKTSGHYGLKLRFATQVLTSNTSDTNVAKQSLSNLPMKKEGEFNSAYVIVIVFLMIAFILLWTVKRKMGIGGTSGNKQPWLFKSNSAPVDNVNIRFQKSIDQKNRVVMLDYADQSYLVVIGNSNIVLDKFEGNKPSTQSQFDEILDDNRAELDSFLQIDADKDDSLFSYKEKVSKQNLPNDLL